MTLTVVVSPTGSTTYTCSDPNIDIDELRTDLNSPYATIDAGKFESFIRDSPLDRGRSFASLVGLEKLSKLRKALAKLSNSGNVERDLLISNKQAELDNLQIDLKDKYNKLHKCFMILAGSQVYSPFDPVLSAEVCSDLLKQDAFFQDLLLDCDLIDIDAELLDKKLDQADNAGLRDHLSLCRHDLRTLKGYKESLERYRISPLLAGWAKAKEKYGENSEREQLYSLYSQATDIILQRESGDNKTCPVCDTVIEPNLIDNLKEKIEPFRKYRQAANRSMDQSLYPSIDRLRSIEEQDMLGILPHARVIATSYTPFAIDRLTADDIETLRKYWDYLLNRIVILIEFYEKYILENESALPEQLVELTRKVEAAKFVATLVPEFCAARTKAVALAYDIAVAEQWKTFIFSISEEHANAEVSVSSARVNALADKQKDYYRQITGSDQIVPVLERAEASERMLLKLDQFFTERDLPALPMLNESYSKAVAMSIYLAAISQSTISCRCVAMDDITTSLDGRAIACNSGLANRAG